MTVHLFLLFSKAVMLFKSRATNWANHNIILKSTYSELFWKIAVLKNVIIFSRKRLSMSLFFKGNRAAACYFSTYVLWRVLFNELPFNLTSYYSVSRFAIFFYELPWDVTSCFRFFAIECHFLPFHWYTLEENRFPTQKT